MTLTDRQQAVLDYLRQHVATHGRPPTLWEVAQAFGLASPNGVAKHLQALSDKGFIALEPGRARGIRLLGPNPQAGGMVLPILGRVAAGAPIGAAGELGEGLLVDARLFKRTPDYLLRVQCQSMRDDGIFDGDLVAVQRAETADSGTTVVARLGEEITIKRLKRTGRFQARSATRLITAWFHSEFDPDRSMRCTAPAGCASRGACVGGC